MLLSAVLACALLIPVTAEEAHASDQPRIVKVGYTDSEGLLTKNDDGTYEGYTYDYLMRLSLIHISEPTRPQQLSRMPSSA